LREITARIWYILDSQEKSGWEERGAKAAKETVSNTSRATQELKEAVRVSEYIRRASEKAGKKSSQIGRSKGSLQDQSALLVALSDLY